MAEWGMELPQDAEVLYKNWKTGWFGDGFCYTVVEMKPETAALFTQDFSAQKPAMIEEKIEKELEVLQKSDAEQIPEEFALQFPLKEGMIYKEAAEEHKSDRLYLMYDAETNRLYLCEIRG